MVDRTGYYPREVSSDGDTTIVVSGDDDDDDGSAMTPNVRLMCQRAARLFAHEPAATRPCVAVNVFIVGDVGAASVAFTEYYARQTTLPTTRLTRVRAVQLAAVDAGARAQDSCACTSTYQRGCAQWLVLANALVEAFVASQWCPTAEHSPPPLFRPRVNVYPLSIEQFICAYIPIGGGALWQLEDYEVHAIARTMRLLRAYMDRAATPGARSLLVYMRAPRPSAATCATHGHLRSRIHDNYEEWMASACGPSAAVAAPLALPCPDRDRTVPTIVVNQTVEPLVQIVAHIDAAVLALLTPADAVRTWTSERLAPGGVYALQSLARGGVMPGSVEAAERELLASYVPDTHSLRRSYVGMERLPARLDGGADDGADDVLPHGTLALDAAYPTDVESGEQRVDALTSSDPACGVQ